MIAQINHQTTKYAAGNKWHSNLFTNGEKPTRQIPHRGDFQVTTPKIHLLSQQVVTSKGILVTYTNLKLNPYPNTQLDLFCSDNFSFWCMAPSMWLTNCADPSTQLQSPTREGCWLQSYSVHPRDEDQEDAWSQNPTVHKQGNYVPKTMN